MEMELKYTFEQSEVYQRVVEAIRQGTRSIREVALAAHTADRHASRILRYLRNQGVIHIASWRRGRCGPPTALYRWGAGTDAVRPEPLKAALKCKSYRESQRKKFGEKYGLVHAAQKQHIPGRRIVVDGQVIYST